MLITLNGEASANDKTGSYDFTNSIRSGFELKPDSKIALVSASIERVVDIVIVSSTNGNLKMEINHTTAGGFNYTDITIPSGTYSYDTLLPEIESRLDAEFGSQGYLFNVHLHNAGAGGDDEVRIEWNVSDVAGVAGLPELPASGMTDSTITVAAPGGDTNKLAIVGAAVQDVWYMAACPNTMPNYKLFSVPGENNPKISNFVEIGDLNLAAAADEGILGVYDPTSELPDGYNGNVGAFAMVCEPAGAIHIYETHYTDLDIDYISNSQTWDISFNAGATWKFVEYSGGDGAYDYVLEEQTGANEYFVKKIPGTNGTEAYFNYTNTGNPNNFDLKMILNAGKNQFAFEDPAGAGAGTCSIIAGQVPAKLSTNHGLAKQVGTIPAGSIDKNGGVMVAGWGKEGYVKYFIKTNKSNVAYIELTISDPNRPTVDEMFGGEQGHQFDSYWGIKMTGAAITSPLNALDLLDHTASANNTEAIVDDNFKDNNLTNYGCVIDGTASPTTIEGIASNGCASSNASYVRQPFRNATWSMIVDNTLPAAPVSGQFGLLDTQEFTNFTNQGATTGGIWNNNSNHRARIYWTLAGFRMYIAGGFANGSTSSISFATTGDKPKIELEVDGSGHIFFNYYKQSENYGIKHRFFTNSNLIPNGAGVLLHPYWMFNNDNKMEDFKATQENTAINTGVVAFNPDTLRNVLGFNSGDYTEGNGQRGFTSNRTLGYAESFTCASPLLHVNLKNLPVQSLNGKTNRQEKCIAVIPRYNVDNEEGNVNNIMGNKTVFYYEPYNMLYQPLNNAMPISMNEIAISMLNNDGTFATDLECTSIVLDIQPNPVASLR